MEALKKELKPIYYETVVVGHDGIHVVRVPILVEDVFYDQSARQMNPEGVHSAHHPLGGDLSAKIDKQSSPSISASSSSSSLGSLGSIGSLR
jgi:predicted heme/steroid binding protein